MALEKVFKRQRVQASNSGIGRQKKKSSGTTSRKQTIKKGRWSSDEDDKLVQLVKEQQEKNEEINWDEVEEGFQTRSKKQCRERWLSQLDPTLKKTDWTTDEDELLLELSNELNNKWAEIARRIPGRTENMVKNRWHALDRMSNGPKGPRRKKLKASRRVRTSKRDRLNTTHDNEEASDEVYPLSCISNTEQKRRDPNANMKLELAVSNNFDYRDNSADPLMKYPSNFDLKGDNMKLGRLNSLEFDAQPFEDKPDVIQRHPSFDTGNFENGNSFALDRQFSQNSLKNGRQTSYDLLNMPFGGPFDDKQFAFDDKKNPFLLERQHSLGISQLSNSRIEQLFLEEQYDAGNEIPELY